MQTPRREPRVHRAELLHAVPRERTDGRHDRRGQYRRQGPGQLRVEFLSDHHYDQRPHGEDDRPGADVTELVTYPLEPRDEGFTPRRDAEHARELVGDDDESDAGHEAESEEHTSELQSLRHLVCRLLL